MVSKNLVLMLGLSGLLLAMLGIALGAVFLYAAGFIIAGKKLTLLGIQVWMPIVIDVLPVFLIPWKLSGIIFQRPTEKLKAVALATVPVWIGWKLLGEWLMAESFKYGMTEIMAVEIGSALSAIALHPIVQGIGLCVVVWYIITHM